MRNFYKKNKVILKSQKSFKREAHNICTVKFNNIALSSAYDKRIKTCDFYTKICYGTNEVKIKENEKINHQRVKNKYILKND